MNFNVRFGTCAKKPEHDFYGSLGQSIETYIREPEQRKNLIGQSIDTYVTDDSMITTRDLDKIVDGSYEQDMIGQGDYIGDSEQTDMQQRQEKVSEMAGYIYYVQENDPTMANNIMYNYVYRGLPNEDQYYGKTAIEIAKQAVIDGGDLYTNLIRSYQYWVEAKSAIQNRQPDIVEQEQGSGNLPETNGSKNEKSIGDIISDNMLLFVIVGGLLLFLFLKD